MKKQYNIVIGGYYGYGSLGDEAVLFSILTGIAKRLPESRVTVLCKNPCSIPRIPGIELVFKSRTNPISVIDAMALADLYICGGGSLLQDFTSKRSLFYYCSLLRLASLFKCKIFIYANGIGPIKNEKKCRTALLLADIISVRDPASLALCQRLLSTHASPVLSADPIFAHPFAGKRFPFQSIKELGRPYFAVSLRSTRNGERVDLKGLCEIISSLAAEGMLPVFVPMQDFYDLEISEKAALLTGGRVVRTNDPDELYCLLEKASFALGMRLHFLLTAAIAGTAAVALSYDPKIEGCLKPLGIDTVVSAFDFSKDELQELINKARACHSKSNTEAACRQQKSLAEGDFDSIAALLKSEKEATEKYFADT